MITFVMTEEHQYTLRAALESGALRREMILLSYEDFLSSERLPESDYVFVDLERLDGARIEAAARRLEALRRVCPGIGVLNAPRRELGRLEVMRALHSGGVNRFRVMPASEIPADLSYPVFLRRLDNHDGPMTGLLADAAALEAALGDLVAAGFRREALAVTEYVDARNAEGLHEKLSYFRIGETLFPSALDLSTDWVCKGAIEDENAVPMPEREMSFLTSDAHDAPMRAAFDAAGIGYGRADYVMVGGAPQLFEINTNPFLDPPESLPPELQEYSRMLLGHWREALEVFSPCERGEAPRWVAVEGAVARGDSPDHRLRRAFRGVLIATGQLHREMAIMRPVRIPGRIARRGRDWLLAIRAPGQGRGI